jgi:hypothetical protein
MNKVVDTPFALTSDGTLLLNVTHTDGNVHSTALLERELAIQGADVRWRRVESRYEKVRSDSLVRRIS